MAVAPELLYAVKNDVDITWSLSPDDEARLEGQIGRGMAYLNRMCGSEQDYSRSGKPYELLVEYVYYARNSMLDRYQRDYASELINLKGGAYGEKTSIP